MSREERSSGNGLLVVILIAVMIGVVLLVVCGLGLRFFFVTREARPFAVEFPVPQDSKFVQGAMKEASDEENAPILAPGGSITHDGITLTLEKVQRGDFGTWENGKDVVLKDHFVLTFRFDNKSKDVIVKNPGVGLQKGRDNAGNALDEVIALFSHNGQESSSEVRPGQSGISYMILKPTVDSALNFEGVLRWKTISSSDFHLGRLKFSMEDVTKIN